MNSVKVEGSSFDGRRVDHLSDVAAVSFIVWAEPYVITLHKPHLERDMVREQRDKWMKRRAEN